MSETPRLAGFASSVRAPPSARQPFVARLATDDEKAEMWPRIVDAHRGSDGDPSKTDRSIPVTVCEPRNN